MGWALLLGMVVAVIIYFHHALVWLAWMVGGFLFLVLLGYLMQSPADKQARWEAKNADAILTRRQIEEERQRDKRLQEEGFHERPSYDPKTFEGQIADLFRAHGYRVVETPYQGDHGIDLKAYKPEEFAIVQCKRFTGSNVGEPVVRDFFGCMLHENADIGFIFTTSDFTASARKWATGKKIVLVNGEMLEKMMQETIPKRVNE